MNNKFDSKYEIRIANYDEIDEIMNFIDKYWKKNHIMATNRILFEYEFINNNKVNIFIAKNKKTKEIEAMIGALFASQNSSKLDIWGTMWKRRNDCEVIKGLGFEVLSRMIEYYKARNYIVVGSNPITATPLLQKYWQYLDFKMDHYYRLSNITNYKIANIKEKIIIPKPTNKPQKLPVEVHSIEELKSIFDFSLIENNIPYKDIWYYNHRFFKHPIYNYKIYALNDIFIVIREQTLKDSDSKILRIVDCAGNQKRFGNLYNFFEQFLNKYEYIDFYNFGFNKKAIENAGFINKIKTPNNIIPNYFAPFVNKNIDIHLASKTKNYTFFKGDSDQDRPN